MYDQRDLLKDPSEYLVYLVEDNLDLREMIVMLFEGVGWRVCTFSSGIEFLKNCSDADGSCVVLDVRLQMGESGLRVQDELIRSNSKLPVVFITGHGDIRMAVQAMSKGASNFLTKPFRTQELLDSVFECMMRLQSPEEIHEIELVEKRYGILTKRELEVLRLICEGNANKKIGFALDISVHTVEVHRASILKKMEARTTAHLLSMVFRYKLLA